MDEPTIQSLRCLGGRRARLAPEQWRQMQRDYEESDHTVAYIAQHYEVTLHRIAKHAQRYGWRKPLRAAPPLITPPDPEQVTFDANGGAASAWETIAHDAQRPPAGEWITWLFQGGRGAGKTRAGAEWLAARAETEPAACSHWSGRPNTTCAK
jgi:hypothetical protein